MLISRSKPDLSFFGVFDGHAGIRAADLCVQQFPERVSTIFSNTSCSEEHQICSALSKMYCDVNEEFCTQATANGWLDGTTACSVMLKL
jgi:serine/threonine protein phosphatase PrpC